MQNAVVALMTGGGTFAVHYLKASGIEEMVLREVLKQATKAQHAQRKAEIESIGNATANALARMFRKS